MGLQYTAVEGHQLPQLNAVRIPAGVDDVAVRKLLLAEFGIEIGGGLGDFKGKAWRIGLMGYNSRPELRPAGAGGAGTMSDEGRSKGVAGGRSRRRERRLRKRNEE